MDQEKFEIGEYTTGLKKDVTYEDMGQKHNKLSSDQVRKIAIARAKAKVNNENDILTIKDNTKGELEVVRLDIEKPERIIIDDNTIDVKLRTTLKYNHTQIKKFEKEIKERFSKIEKSIPESGKNAFAAFKKIYDSDIYSPESIKNVKELQGIIGLNGADVDGKFGPKTQKKLIEVLSAPTPAPTPAPKTKENNRPTTTSQADKID